MKTEKNSVEGQLDIFEAMNRAAAAVDRMMEEDKKTGKEKKGKEKKAEKSVCSELESSIEVAGEAEKKSVKKVEIIRGASMHASLQKTFINTVTDDFAVVAYIDYNMVYYKDWNAPASLRKFNNSKEAVDYYMEQLGRIQATEDARVTEENEPFLDVKYVVENVYAECE
jgi:hypothetical protein